MSIEAIQWLVQTGTHLDMAEKVGEVMAKAMHDRNAIERAKLAEMRAARLMHSLLNDGPYEAKFAQEANEEADRLTAEALGEMGGSNAV